MEKLVVIITGPTCSGKSDIAYRLAQMMDTEIISADSRQMYRELNIGTAKPPKEYLNTVKHHFIDSHSLTESFDAGEFEQESINIISRLHGENKIPIACGGSGLYIRSLKTGIIDIPPNEEVRESLDQKRQAIGNEGIYALLQTVDPESAEKMIPQNYKRVMRALEVFYITNKTIGEIQKNHKRDFNPVFLMFGINWEREILYDRVNKRVDKMMEEGLLKEVQSITASENYRGLNALNTVGYKEIIAHLNGETTLETAISHIKRNTRHFAKRQLTWFRDEPDIKWLPAANESTISNFCEIIHAEIVNYRS